MRNEVDRDRQRLVREGELTCEVIRRAHFEGAAIWESERDLGKRLGDEEWREGGKVSHLNQDASAS